MNRFLSYAPLLFSSLTAGGAALAAFSYFGNGAIPFATAAFFLVLAAGLLLRAAGKRQSAILAVLFILLLAMLFFAGKESTLSAAAEALKVLGDPYDMDLSLSAAVASAMPFKVWLLLLISWFFAAGVISKTARAAAFLVSLFILLIGFYFGVNPGSLSVVLTAAYGLTLPVTFMNRGPGRPETFVYLLALLLGGLTMGLIPESQYEQPGFLSRLQENVISMTDPYDPIFHAGNAYAGLSRGAGHDKLGTTDAIHYTGRAIADVETADVDKRLYLRSWVGGQYEENRWNDLPARDYDGTEYLFTKNQGEWYDQGAWLMEVMSRNPALLQRLTNYMDDRTDLTRMKQDFSITAVYEKTNTLFLPYDADFGAPFFVYDRAPVTEGGKAYTTDMWHLPAGPLLSMMTRETIRDPYYATYINGEQRYRDFVYALYLTVPPKVQEALTRLGTFTKVETLSEKRERVTAIQQLLEQNYTYTRHPGRTPEGEDFISYFLLRQGRGYCTHFASAAVMMLRASGIPSRYVVGLSVGPEEINGAPLTSRGTHRLSISDHHAHAWVEVYVDGLGWRPAEMTPGMPGAENPFPIPPDKQRNDTGAPDKPADPEDRTGETPQDNRPHAQQQQPMQRSQPPAARPQPPDPQPAASFLFPFLVLLFLIAVAGAAVWYRATWAGRLIKRGADSKENWNLVLAYLATLTTACGIPQTGSYEEMRNALAADSRLSSLAPLLDQLVKARFSGVPLTAEEKQAVLPAIADARKRYFAAMKPVTALLTKVRYKR